jgi:hypothetical protein
MQKLFMLFLLGIFTASSLYAGDSDIDLRSEFGSIRDQGQMGFCNSYAAVDLLSYWLNNSAGFKNTKKDTRIKENMVSALAYALLYHIKQNNPKTEKYNLAMLHKKVKQASNKVDKITENIYKTNLKAIEIQKEIEQSSTESENSNLYDQLQNILKSNKEYETATTEYEKTMSDLMEISIPEIPFFYEDQETGNFATIEDLSDMTICFEKEVSSIGLVSIKKDSEIVSYSNSDIIYSLQMTCAKNAINFRDKNKEDNKAFIQEIKILFPNIKTRVIKKIMDQSQKSTYQKPISFFLKKNCDLNRKLGKRAPVIKHYSVNQGIKVLNWIDIALENKKPVPVFIIYNPDVFSLRWQSLFNDAVHASVVVGKLKNPDTKKTEYIIRNSWGESACKSEYESYYGLTIGQEQELEQELIDIIAQKCKCDDPDKEKCFKKYADENAEKAKELALKAPRSYRCENGYYIIEKDALEQVISDVAWLEDPDKNNTKVKHGI